MRSRGLHEARFSRMQSDQSEMSPETPETTGPPPASPTRQWGISAFYTENLTVAPESNIFSYLGAVLN